MTRRWMGSWDDKGKAYGPIRPWLPKTDGNGRPYETYASITQSRKRALRATSRAAAARRIARMIEGGPR